jgi:hypothetical protein
MVVRETRKAGNAECCIEEPTARVEHAAKLLW